MAKAVIELKNVSKKYGLGEVEFSALDNVSIQVMQNDFIAVMGPSGKLKTTN